MSKHARLSDLPAYRDLTREEIVENQVSLTWNVDLPPHIDTERIEVSLSRIRLLHTVGAMVASHVFDHQGEVSEHTPAITGVNADGSAVAARTGHVKRANKAMGGYLDTDINIPPSWRSHIGKPVALHSLNRAEVASDISDKVREKGLSREEAWAISLDEALRDSFKRAGRAHLVERDPDCWRYLEYGIFSGSGFLAAQQIMAGQEVSFIPRWLAVQGGIAALGALGMKLSTGEAQLKEKRWSIFIGGHQSDRYLALNALTKVPGLIRVKK